MFNKQKKGKNKRFKQNHYLKIENYCNIYKFYSFLVRVISKVGVILKMNKIPSAYVKQKSTKKGYLITKIKQNTKKMTTEHLTDKLRLCYPNATKYRDWIHLLRKNTLDFIGIRCYKYERCVNYYKTPIQIFQIGWSGYCQLFRMSWIWLTKHYLIY